MLYLSGCVRDDLPPEFGVMLTPMMGNRLPPVRAWAADTGCFNQPEKHNNDAYLAWLVARDLDRCLFATAPDVVGDARATLERSLSMLCRIREAGYRAALVAQDGLESLAVPWLEFDCLFIGGSTAWKVSAAVTGLVAEAKVHNKRVHMGRVNSLRRLRIAKRMGCDSCDGTYLTFSPDVLGPRMDRWVRGVREQMVLDL